MKPVYFDLTVRDLDVARTFFSAVLGWTFDRFEGIGYPYSRIQSRSEDEVGIGEIRDAPMSEGRPLTLVTIQVPKLDKLLRLVEENVDGSPDRAPSGRGVTEDPQAGRTE